MKNLIFLIPVALLLAACNGKQAGTTPPVSSSKTDKEATPADPPIIKYIAFPKSTGFDDTKLESMDYKNGKFSFTYSGTDYKLGAQTPDAAQLMCANSDKGQHIHLIIDNQSYQASYATDFELAVPDGEHIILAFLSRSYHESIKNGQAYLAKRVKISKGNIVSSKDIKEPMLFYSRPKGTYTGTKETDKILFDYYLINVNPTAGYKVRVEVNNEPARLMQIWKPHYIKGLPMGDNKIKLTLLDKKNEVVKSAINPVERTFTLVAEPLGQ